MYQTTHIHPRRQFLRNLAIAASTPLLPPFLPEANAADRLTSFGSFTLEQQVGQMVIARPANWFLMEEFAKQGLISGTTPSLTKPSPTEVAEFTNRFQKLSPIPLLFGWGGISYSGGTEVRLGQTMRLGATRNAELAREAGRSEAAEDRVSDLIFLANTTLDFGMPSAKFARDWVKKNGGEKLNR